MKKILSLDGGGVRGWLMIALLAKIEKRLQEIKKDPSVRLIDFFDIITGTSVGGILASLLVLPHRPSAAEVRVYFENYVGKIFPNSIFSWLWSWEKPKYSTEPITKFATEMIGLMRLSEIQKTLVLTAYDLKKQRIKLLTNSKVKLSYKDFLEQEPEDFNLADAVRATASAPTFFAPAEVKSCSGTDYLLIDGGVAANNPSLFSILFAPSLDSIYLLSLGSGDESQLYNVNYLVAGGKLAWAMPLINILFNNASDTTDFQCRRILGSNLMNKYHRLNPELKKTSITLDDCSGPNLKAMQSDLEIWTAKLEIDQLIHQICVELLESK